MPELTISDIFTDFPKDYRMVKYIFYFSFLYLTIISALLFISEAQSVAFFFIFIYPGIAALFFTIKYKKNKYPKKEKLITIKSDENSEKDNLGDNFEINTELESKINNILEKMKSNSKLFQLLNFILIIPVPLLVMNLILSIVTLYQLVVLNYVFTNLIPFISYHSVFLFLNLFVFFVQGLRIIDFLIISRINLHLENDFGKRIDECLDHFKEYTSTNIKELDVDKEKLLISLNNWNELYLGTFFNSAKFNLKISDFRDLLFIEDDEQYYAYVFSNLKHRLLDYLNYNVIEGKINETKEKLNNVLLIIENIINKLDYNIKLNSQILKNKRERKKMITIWLRIISSPISIFFTLFYFFSGIV